MVMPMSYQEFQMKRNFVIVTEQELIWSFYLVEDVNFAQEHIINGQDFKRMLMMWFH